MAMQKPARLEWNNSGAWKLLGRFDIANEEVTGEILQAADHLVRALNDPSSGRPSICSLRISVDDALQGVLLRWVQDRDGEGGWRDAETGEAV